MSRDEKGASVEEIAAAVDRVIYDVFHGEREKIVPDARLIEDLGFDSLDTVELVMGLEEEFGLDIFDDAVGRANPKTVADVHRFVADLLTPASAVEEPS